MVEDGRVKYWTSVVVSKGENNDLPVVGLCIVPVGTFESFFQPVSSGCGCTFPPNDLEIGYEIRNMDRAWNVLAIKAISLNGI